MFMCVEKLLPASVEQLREAKTAQVIRPEENGALRGAHNDTKDAIVLDEENLEALVRLLETAGKHLDGDKMRPVSAGWSMVFLGCCRCRLLMQLTRARCQPNRDEEELARRIDRAPDMATKQKRGKRGKSKHASALDVCFERMRALVDNADIPICNRIRFLIRDVIVSCPRYRSCILFFYVTNCPVSLLNRFVGKTLRKCAQINGLRCVLPQKKSKRSRERKRRSGMLLYR